MHKAKVAVCYCYGKGVVRFVWGCRVPLTEANLKPNVELKARIQQWRAEHSGARME